MASSSSSSSSFPDLQMKMSKKIAQLTKVIYHLNTVNEDHQSEMSTQAEAHQKEMQEVVRDSKAKISALHKMLHSRKEQVNLEAQIEQLKAKHAQEKEVAMKEFASFKNKVKAREEQYAGIFADQTATLREEILAVKERGQETMRRCADVTAELVKAKASLAGDTAKQVADLKEKHKQEVDDLVKTSNDKYSKMLAEQMMTQESLRQQLKDQAREAEKHLQRELEDAVGKVRAELRAAHQSELLQQQKSHDQSLRATRDELLAKLDSLSNEVASLEESRSKLDREKEALVEELRTVGKDRDATQAALQRSENDLAKSREELERCRAELAAHMSNASASAEEISQRLAESQTQVSQLEKQVQALQAEREQASRAVLAAGEEKRKIQEMHDAFAQRMTDEMVARDGELAQAKKQVLVLSKQLEDEKQSRSKVLGDLAESAAIVANLEQQIQALQSQLQSTKDGASDALETERAAMAQRVTELENEWKRKEAALRAELDSKLADAAAKAKEIEAAAQRALEEERAKYAVEQDKLKQKAASELENLRQALEIKIQEAAATHSQALDALRKEMELLEAELMELRDQSSGDAEKLKRESEAMEANLAETKSQLARSQAEAKQWISTCDSLKAQVEDLRRQLDESQRAAERRLASELARVEKEWGAKLVESQGSASDELKRLLEEAEARRNRELEELKSRLEQERDSAVSKLEDELAREKTQAEDQMAAAESRRKQELEEASATISKLQEELERTRGEGSEAVRNLEERMREQLRQQHSELSLQRENDLAAALADKEETVFKLEQEHGQAMTQAGEAHAAELDQRRREADDAMAKAMAAAQDEHRAEVVQMEARCAEERRCEVADLAAKFDADRRKMVAELTETNQHLLDKSQMCTSLENEVRRRTDELQSTRDRSQRELAEQQAGSEEREAHLRSTHAAECETLRRQHEYDKEGMRQELQSKLDALQTEFNELLHRWETRESRPEDLARIEELTNQMIEMDKLVKKTQEEMAYFKRELLNREENFNKRFNAHPNVGVMQVIKTKDAKQPPGKPNGRRPSGGKSHRPLAPQTSFSVGGGAGGGEIGASLGIGL